MAIVSVSNRDTMNLGDLVCSPCLYFDYGDVEYADIRGDLPPADSYIFGGGAIFRRANQARVRGDKIGWGVGQTRRGDRTTKGDTPEDFLLFGSRDVGQAGAQWVPCPSCMSPLFDKKYKVKRRVVGYINSSIRNQPTLPYMDAIFNTGTFEDAIRFIASGRVCVTNSYHGAYWATLLGRKAIVVNPYSSKFYNYKHQPAVIDSSDWENEFLKPVSFPDALDECRTANIDFDAQVRELIF